MGDRFLVAYFVPKQDGGPSPTGEELRTYAKAYLPDYMVPALFEQIDILPVNENGKLDRRALRQVRRGFFEKDELRNAPATELEKVLTQIWCQVLDLLSVSVDDNFFELGGTSLSMVRVRDALSKSFKRELPMVKLFQHPTIRSLAKYLEGYERSVVMERSQSIASRRRQNLSNLMRGRKRE